MLILLLHSFFILVGIFLVVIALINSDFRALTGGIVILTISSWKLVKRIKRRDIAKKTTFEQTLEDIKQGKNIKI